MIDFASIRLALRTHLLAMTGCPPVAYENRDFDPEAQPKVNDTILFIEERLIEGPQRRLSTGFLTTTSQVLYAVCVPKGTGTERQDAVAKAITTRFVVNTVLGTAPQRIVVERSEQLASYFRGDWTVRPVWVTFRVHQAL